MSLAYLPPLLPQPKRGQDLILHTQEVISGGERRQLAAATRYVHRGDPRWVPPLPYARQFALRSDNPLVPGVTAGFLGIARNLGLGDETVGAIAACADTGEKDEGATGWWGLFDAINLGELAERLFYAAETWLFENTPGIAALRGPLSLEPLTPSGMLVDGFDAWPAALLPYNPPYFPELVEAEGYEQAGVWSAWALSCDATRAGKRGRREPVDWKAVSNTFAAPHYAEANALGLRAWLARLARGQSFPAHRHTRWALGRAFARAICARNSDGICLGIPDFAPALRIIGGRLFPIGYALLAVALARSRRLRVFPAHMLDDSSMIGLVALYRELTAKAGAHGYRELVIAPVYDEDEKSAEAMTALGAQMIQRFAIYEKAL